MNEVLGIGAYSLDPEMVHLSAGQWLREISN